MDGASSSLSLAEGLSSVFESLIADHHGKDVEGVQVSFAPPKHAEVVEVKDESARRMFNEHAMQHVRLTALERVIREAKRRYTDQIRELRPRVADAFRAEGRTNPFLFQTRTGRIEIKPPKVASASADEGSRPSSVRPSSLNLGDVRACLHEAVTKALREYRVDPEQVYEPSEATRLATHPHIRATIVRHFRDARLRRQEEKARTLKGSASVTTHVVRSDARRGDGRDQS